MSISHKTLVCISASLCLLSFWSFCYLLCCSVVLKKRECVVLSRKRGKDVVLFWEWCAWEQANIASNQLWNTTQSITVNRITGLNFISYNITQVILNVVASFYVFNIVLPNSVHQRSVLDKKPQVPLLSCEWNQIFKSISILYFYINIAVKKQVCLSVHLFVILQTEKLLFLYMH